MSFNLQSLLKDKNALYVTLFVAVTNVFAYLMFRQFDAIIFFIIIATIVSNFSKNMIIILLSAILTTNLAISIKMIGKVKEGMKNMKDDKKKKAAVETKNVKEPMSKNKNNKPKPTCSGDSCNKNKNNKEKFTQKLRPANINGDDNTDDIEDNATVDYASTLESAYDNVDKLLTSYVTNIFYK